MKRFIFLFVILLVACNEEKSNKSGDGSISGGGGFAATNSESLLKLATQNLVHRIKILPDSQFEKLANGWTREEMISVYENIRYSYSKTVFREDKELLFNYQKEPTPQLEAVRGYFLAYSWVPEDKEAQEAVIEDIQLKLVHEFGHLMDFSEEESANYSHSFKRKLDTDLMVCKIDLNDNIPMPNAFGEKGQKRFGSKYEHVWPHSIGGDRYFLIRKYDGAGLFVDTSILHALRSDTSESIADQFLRLRFENEMLAPLDWNINWKSNHSFSASTRIVENTPIGYAREAEYKISGTVATDSDEYTVNYSFDSTTQKHPSGGNSMACKNAHVFFDQNNLREPSKLVCEDQGKTLSVKLPECDQGSEADSEFASITISSSRCSDPLKFVKVLYIRKLPGNRGLYDYYYTAASTPFNIFYTNPVDMGLDDNKPRTRPYPSCWLE